MDERSLLHRARTGDDAAFEELVAPYLPQLHARCYRLLASAHDADDAVQEALIGAWRGIGGFEERSSLRGWLYRIGASNVDPAVAYDAREAVELAFVAALQHVPASQRAVLLLRAVLGFSAAETAEILDLTVAAANSQLQRARATHACRLPDRMHQVVRAELGAEAERRLVADLVAAWEARDVDGFVALLVDDVRLSMPPLPAWFDGAASVRRFLGRMLQTPWRS